MKPAPDHAACCSLPKLWSIAETAVRLPFAVIRMKRQPVSRTAAAGQAEAVRPESPPSQHQQHKSKPS
ncbi:hypothetical protein [Paenibacillus sp. 32O-W]|uniref:hypothetical protein n=1 Tax=Paenibacillus sp. 32O-W TaxID=1695218 RepID=UPI0011AE5787|nr:hypothetical protein [Paenibacillus sp. 32O-W]